MRSEFRVTSSIRSTRERRSLTLWGIAAGVVLGSVGVALLVRETPEPPPAALGLPIRGAATPAPADVATPPPSPLIAPKVEAPSPDPSPSEAPAQLRPNPTAASSKPAKARAPRAEPRPPPKAAEPAMAPGLSASELVQAATRELTQGHINAAADYYTQASRVDPHSEAAFRGLGLTNERLGKKAEAIRAFRRALSLAPNGQNAEMLRVRLQRLEAAP